MAVIVPWWFAPFAFVLKWARRKVKGEVVQSSLPKMGAKITITASDKEMESYLMGPHSLTPSLHCIAHG